MSGENNYGVRVHLLDEDDWSSPRALAAKWGDHADRYAFGLLRPDAVYQGLVPQFFDLASRRGFAPVDALVIWPHPRQLEELYRYTQGRVLSAGYRIMWWYSLRLYELAPSVAFLLRHDDSSLSAAETLAKAKGPSNPILARPKHIRTLLNAQNTAMSALHCSDKTDNMLREACLFFGARRVEKSLGDRPSQRFDLRRLLSELSEHGFAQGVRGSSSNFHQRLVTCHYELLERLHQNESIDLSPALRVVEEAVSTLVGAYADRQLRFDDYFLELSSTKNFQNLRDSRQVQIIDWSANLERAGEARVEAVVEDFIRYGAVLDRYDRLLLETGFGFHAPMTFEARSRSVIGEKAVLSCNTSKDDHSNSL